MNPQAEELNKVIQAANPAVFDMLSTKGKASFFPKLGILGQSADAKSSKINATIGAAVEDDGSPMRLASLESQMNLEPAMAFPYAPSYGRPDLRNKWKEMIYQKNPNLKGIELSLPVVTNALTHALSIVGHMFLDEGTTVLVSDLFWGNYNLIFKSWYNANIDTFTLFEGNGFNLKSFEETVANMPAGKKVILLNFPNNPTGYTPTTSEMAAIADILKKDAEKGNKLVVVTDDAYFGLVFEEGVETQSAFAFLANLHENVLAVKVDGPTKEDYVWGFRVGFITYGIKGGTEEFYTAMGAKTGGAIRGNISNACNVTQSMLLKAFSNPNYEAEKKAKFDILNARYKAVKEVLKNETYKEYFTQYPYNSGYFMCVKLADGLDGEAIRKILNEKYSTGIINMNNVFRMAFAAVAASNMKDLFDNIYNACKDYATSK